MKKFCLSNLQFLLLAVLMMAMTGCGASKLGSVSDTQATGAVASKLVWNDGKSTAKSVAAVAPDGVTRIQVTVSGSDSNGKALPVVKGTMDIATNQGTIAGIYPGRVTLAVKAFTGSTVSYEGFAIGVLVSSGATTTLAEPIVMSAPVEKAADAPCIACHETTLDATGQNLVADFKQSGHYTNQAWTSNAKFGVTGTGCAGCHGPKHDDRSPVESGRCYECHGSTLDKSHDGYQVQFKCDSCHNSHNTNQFVNGRCTGCHSIGQNATASGAYVNDNNGVRAITNEFSKWSHHVTGVALNDAHCAACHLEGKVVNGAVVVDSTKHMVDAKTHLRNADSDADFAWDPMAPNHSGMDLYCMSCHDENGATSAMSLKIQAFINDNGLAAPGKVASPSNPFGDTISNKYDKMLRPAVVDVKGQFDLTNPSHHAVMGKRYTGRTTAPGPRQIASPATFGANSSAALPGTRQTLYDAGKLNAAYLTLSPAVGSDYTLGDDSVLHCGDCHTVGQWKPGSSVDMNGNPTTVAIGAHGSNNEYMLRNTAGTDQLHVGHTLDATGAISNWGAPWLVCYNCHAFQAYGSPRANTLTHAGEYNVANARCNSPNINFAGYTTGTIVTKSLVGGFTYTMNQSRLRQSGATGGTIFGMQCSNCHNSGPANSFGGIHGSKVKVYTDGTGAQQKAYRFMPGLGNTMYNPGSMGALNNGTAAKGSVDDKNWEQKSLTTANREGCYTLAGTSAGLAPGRLGNGNTINGQEIFGTWGACTDHGGTSVQGGVGVTRKVIRPVSY